MKSAVVGFSLFAGLIGLALYTTILARSPDMPETIADQAAGGAKEGPAGSPEKLAHATFGTGCFWCTEAVFDQLQGVRSVVSGYSGGNVVNPTYEQVCSGSTGHAEAVDITYDPANISYAELLEAFWQSHDPTTLNRQGNDVGTQYRSAIFYRNDAERREAEHYKQKLNESGAFRAPIVTEIVPYKEFYPAEKYHQDFFNLNPTQPYCAAIIRPKIEKFRKVFKDKLKDTPHAAAAAQP
jgi:peptide-methionine (S)-S-oxide reductase